MPSVTATRTAIGWLNLPIAATKPAYAVVTPKVLVMPLAWAGRASVNQELFHSYHSFLEEWLVKVFWGRHQRMHPRGGARGSTATVHSGSSASPPPLPACQA